MRTLQPGDGTTVLLIPSTLYQRVLDHCRSEWPREACGIMTGRAGLVRRVFALRNVHSQPTTRFQIDPADQQVAMVDVLAGRENLVAIYHSHPTTAAYPSQTDVEMAYYPESLYLIVSLARETPEAGAFRIVHGQVTRVPIRQTDSSGGEWIDLR